MNCIGHAGLLVFKERKKIGGGGERYVGGTRWLPEKGRVSVTRFGRVVKRGEKGRKGCSEREVWSGRLLKEGCLRKSIDTFVHVACS